MECNDCKLKKDAYEQRLMQEYANKYAKKTLQECRDTDMTPPAYISSSNIEYFKGDMYTQKMNDCVYGINPHILCDVCRVKKEILNEERLKSLVQEFIRVK